ncbi:MAG TPA: hypothetical protein VMD53_09495 [Rhizomicrobium sp.]|nr:hypothetical protein [Rhizomicrobium sp.]
MTTWDACTFEPNSWLRWVECHPGLAGYIQAIGTIGAILVAILAPVIATQWQSHLEYRARLQRSKTLAGSMRNTIWDVDAEVRRVGELLAAATEPPEDTMNGNFLARQLVLRLPPKLDLFYQVVAGTELSITRQFVDTANAVRNYNNPIAPYASGDQLLQPKDWLTTRDALQYNLGLARGEVERARAIAERYAD